jgi:hypothetical protein
MSRLSYLDISADTLAAHVTMGNVPLADVANVPEHGSGLRIYAFDNATHGSPSLGAFSLCSRLLTNVAHRESIFRHTLRAEHLHVGRLLYACDLADQHLTHVAVSEIMALAQEWVDRGRHMMLLDVRGDDVSVEKLLDEVPGTIPDKICAATSGGDGEVTADQNAKIAFRDELLAKGWPDSHLVAKRSGVLGKPNQAPYVSGLRSRKKILGVWSTPAQTFVHPDFQFDEFGKARPLMKALLAILPDEDDRGGWNRAFWLYSPHSLLNGALPAEEFAIDPKRVIAAARSQFQSEGPDAHW